MIITELYKKLFGREAMSNGTVIEMAEHGRAGGTSADQGFKYTDKPPMNQKITVVDTVTYIGLSAPGTSQSESKWQCKKIDESVAGTTIITWADKGNYSQVATDLTALTYS